MRHLPFETAHTWITRLAAHPDPLTFNQIQPIAAELGWEPTHRPGTYLYQHGSDAPRISALGNSDTNKLHNVSFALVYNVDKDLADNIAVADLYADYITAATRAWGPPTDYTTNRTGTIWKLHPHAYIDITTWPHSILCFFETDDPNYLG